MPPAKARTLSIALGLIAGMLALPAPSHGGLFDWWLPPSRPPAPSVTTYAAPSWATSRSVYMPGASPAAAYAPRAAAPWGYTGGTGAVAQTCNYVPKTTYRWSYSRVDFTRVRPVQTCDPCTGATTTVYRPVVVWRTLLPWLHRKPKTSYQLSCAPTSGVACPTSCVSGCPTGVVGAAYQSGGSGCSSGCAPTVTYPSPASSSASPDPGYSPPSPQRTFETRRSTGEEAPSDRRTSPPRPHPLPATPDPLLGDPASFENPPRLISPENRTARVPVHYAVYHRAPAPIQPVAIPSEPPLDVSGWRAAGE